MKLQQALHRLQILALITLCMGCVAATEATLQTPHATVPKGSAWVANCKDWDEWEKHGPPFRIYGNTYYVGTCGISAILIAGNAGHVLIDGGTSNGAMAIAANIETLGFRLEDVKLLLHSHEHFDHVAGLAELQRRSGARLFASKAAAPVLATGTSSAEDPQAGMHEPFPAAHVDDIVTARRAVRLGKLRLMPNSTPGHTPGALTWQWRACEDKKCLTIVYADSLSPVSAENYRFSDHPEYVEAYRAGLKRLAAIDCDIVLSPHPSASGMHQRLLAGALVDPNGCKAYADGVAKRLDERLTKEAGS